MFYTRQSIGFSVLASVPESSTVFPLLGRPHDSLPTSQKQYDISFPVFRGFGFDASVTNLTYSIPSPSSSSELEVVLSFLSPITPTSTLRQAIPASYLKIYVSGDFDIDIYVDLNGEWVSGSGHNKISWDFAHKKPSPKTSESALAVRAWKSWTKLFAHKESCPETPTLEPEVKTWKVWRTEEQLLTEDRDRAEWGTLHFTGPHDTNHEAGTSSDLRHKFAKNGKLENAVDTSFRGIMEDEPVFAFSKSFKLKSTMAKDEKSQDSVLYTVAHIQDPVVQFASERGLTLMRPLWLSYFPDAASLLKWHYLDFHNAAALARNYSEQLASDALASGSEKYKDIVALSARQVMGATTFAGTPENPLLFLKEISSNGNFQTVDVIFPSFPFFLYTNPRWLAYLLEPLIEHQLSGQYPNQYSMHDLGTHFPNATGHPDGEDEYMPVEECGNMLIMGLALINSLKYDTKPASVWFGSEENPMFEYAESAFPLDVNTEGIDDSWGGPISAKGDKQAQKWIGKSYKLWKQWTGYLVRETLIPSTQLCTDDFAGWLANNTNLALKGIIGIKAMSEISELMGETEDAAYYSKIADEYIVKWEGYGMARNGKYAKLAYTWEGSWTTLYNLYADSLLCFHLPASNEPAISRIPQKPISSASSPKKTFVPERIYKTQSDWYHNVRQRYGLPLDSRHLYTKSDWEFFAAAVTSRSVREEIVESVAVWLNETPTDKPFTDLYDTETGDFPGISFFARPVVGGHFSFLALERACGGQAVQALEFLNDREPEKMDVSQILLQGDRLLEDEDFGEGQLGDGEL